MRPAKEATEQANNNAKKIIESEIEKAIKSGDSGVSTFARINTELESELKKKGYKMKKKSKFTGVYWDDVQSSYYAKLNLAKGIGIRLGFFKKEEDASREFIKARANKKELLIKYYEDRKGFSSETKKIKKSLSHEIRNKNSVLRYENQMKPINFNSTSYNYKRLTKAEKEAIAKEEKRKQKNKPRVILTHVNTKDVVANLVSGDLSKVKSCFHDLQHQLIF